jgi:hypothetical protein
MFSKKLIIILSIYLTIQPFYSYSLSWHEVRSDNEVEYYSEDTNGYYRKISQEELVQQELPKFYIISDKSGYFYQYETEHGGGGSYSFQPTQEMTNNQESYVKIGYIALYKKESAIKQKTATKNDFNFAANYPIYMD